MLKQRTEEFFDGFSNWDYKKILGLCSEKIVWRVHAIKPVGGIYSGTLGIKKLLDKLRFQLPQGLEFNIERLVAESHVVAVEWSDKGYAKDGSAYSNKGMSFIEYDAGGKITEISEIVDSSHLGNLFTH